MNNQILPSDTFTKNQVACGAEARWHKFYIKFTLVWLAVLLALGGILYALVTKVGVKEEWYIIFIFVVAVLSYIVYMLYHVFGYREILACVGKLPICKVVLTNPKRKWHYRRGAWKFYFTVEIQTEYGNFTADTRSMFAIGLITPARLHDYENQEVYVYFDEEKRKVYVIDLVGKLPIPDEQNDKCII